MEDNKVEEITNSFGGHLSLNTETVEKFDRYRQEGKKAALDNNLPRALELFQLAYKLQPSEKLKRRIQAIQDLIQIEADEEEEDDDEFVDVNGSGLMVFKDLYNKLYDHQKEGVAFLYSLYRDGRKGGILADDMGLGKTIQVISFLSGMYDAELAKHTLLVMPTSLIKNWVSEFAKWTPGMRVKEFHGTSKAERNRNLERVHRKGGVLITTYQMLINNYEQLGSYNQQEFRWDYVILDEAHKIKTSSTKTAKSAHAIPAKNRVLLTGTPVQNNLREMWALFDFACQGSLLGTSKTFKTEYENPITRAREKDATPGEKALGLRISQNLMDIIKPYFLRRTKADVQQQKLNREKGFENNGQNNTCSNAREGAEMPSLTRKNDLIVWTYLSSVQEDIYNKFISLDHVKEVLTTTRSPLAELVVLKKLCDHPRLLSHRAVTQLGLEQGSGFVDPDDESESAVSQIQYISDETLIQESGKLLFLISLLECLREEGHRTLVFSQSRKMLDIIERVLRNRDFRLLRLDGTVTQLAEREKRIKMFQTDKRYTIFLLTTQVGGVGITLTAANRVVIFDPSWNPATDAQAVDRAYRIGQTENVIIYRLITCGTVEEKIYRRQVFKDSLIRQTTGDKKNPFRYFSKQDLHELFKLEDTRSSTTQQQLQDMHSHNRRSDTCLDQHIARLYSMEMFGISDHDLMFTKEPSADEDDPEDAEAHHYIQTRVQKAQELMQAESELHGQLVDSIARNTEPAWIRQTEQQKPPVRDHPNTPRIKNEPEKVDWTSYSFDEGDLEANGRNSDVEFVGDVEIVSEGFGDLKSPQANGDHNPNLLKSEISPIADKLADVITLGDSSNGEDESDETPQKHNSLPNFSTPSHRFPKMELSVASDALGEGEEVVLDKSHSKVLSASPSLNKSGGSFITNGEALQANFNLQLEDSADMFSVEEEEVDQPVDESLTEQSQGFQLQMDSSVEELEETSAHDSKQNQSDVFKLYKGNISNFNGEISQRGSLLKTCSAPNTPGDDSFVHLAQRKKRCIISDTEEEEEEEEESEKPCLTSSPLSRGQSRLGSSTPKCALAESTRLHHSINTSVASKRSFLVSILENESDEDSIENITKSSGDSESTDEEDEARGDKSKPHEISDVGDAHVNDSVVEEEETSADGTNSYKISEATEENVDESVIEEEEPSGETLNTEDSEANEEEESGENQQEWQSGLIESTTDAELESSEMMDQCAPKTIPLENQIVPVGTTTKASENTYESLVLSGKQCLAEGKKQEALDIFLKAIDINVGDPEIQLLIIQLYRQLSK
ncbi:hypothetical protein DNTS_012083 [Danionella cerebrum]|uniref:DNA excision repair protein ERCC-6-like n=1 Tax=Danionella cerebrum TaxID=2873325 RepID=A0A553PV46_9TELE|nr:hypothetical protein DNTS_012083 [Danionella translucida]